MNISQIERQLSENALIIRQLQSMQKMQSSADTNADFDAIQSRADDALSNPTESVRVRLVGRAGSRLPSRMASAIEGLAPKWADFPMSGGVREDAFERDRKSDISPMQPGREESGKSPMASCVAFRRRATADHTINEYYGSAASLDGPDSRPCRQYVQVLQHEGFDPIMVRASTRCSRTGP